jgi:hypothetical protein
MPAQGSSRRAARRNGGGGRVQVDCGSSGALVTSDVVPGAKPARLSLGVRRPSRRRARASDAGSGEDDAGWPLRATSAAGSRRRMLLASSPKSCLLC